MLHHNKLFLFICAILLGTNTGNRKRIGENRYTAYDRVLYTLSSLTNILEAQNNQVPTWRWFTTDSQDLEVLNIDIVQSKFIYRSDAQRWIGQEKIVATWEEAKQNCEKAGAILASPINEQLLKYMRSYIEVNGHTNAYFIGTKLKSEPESQYVSIEGIQLDNMPKAVIVMIDKLDPRDGKCLSMNRDSIRVVPCWNRLPYICYTDVTTNGTDSNESTEVERVTQAVETAPPERDEQTEVRTMETPTQAAKSNEVEVTTPVEIVITETNKTTDAAEIAPTTPAPDCNFEEYVYYPVTGRCYRINYFEASWAKANSTCYAEGGYLVILNDVIEATVVTQILEREKVYHRSAWVGLRDETGNGEWRSIHGEALSDLFNELYEPMTNDSDKFCVTLLDERTLHQVDCEDRYSYICEKDAI